ncbi:MAG: RidA family protein [Elusimicrobiota bacterium]
MRRRSLAAALFCVAASWSQAAPPEAADDGLQRLEADPSPSAARRLIGLYKSSKGKDERFWIVRSLENRLLKHGDGAAFDALVEATRDSAPEVRGHAFHALVSFAALPKKALSDARLKDLDAAVRRGKKDAKPEVQAGAQELGRALEEHRRVGPPGPAVEKDRWPTRESAPPGKTGFIRRALALAWVLGFPALILYWTGRKLFMRKKKEAVRALGAPAAIGPYSQAVRCGGLLFVSGQIPADPRTGDISAGGVAEQTEQVLKNLGAILEEAGCGFKDVLKTTVYLTDLSAFAEMNAVYARFFPDPAPARATVQVSALPKGAKIEIEAVVRS